MGDLIAGLRSVVAGGVVVAAVLLPVSAASAGRQSPQWRAAVHVASVPLGGAWFVSGIAAADLNGDGHEDLLITRNARDAEHSYPVTVLLGDGKGHFADGTSSTFGGAVPHTQFARQIVTADFNGDGRADVFIADHGDDHDPWPGYQNTLILSAPGGKLVDATSNLPQASDFTHSAAAADVNGDGAIDIYVGNIGGENGVPPEILLNDGSGHFTVGAGSLPDAVTSFAGQYPGSAFTDANGDGSPDLVLSGDQDTQSAVLENDGSGHFQLVPDAIPAKPFGSNAIGLGPASFDVNGDGRLDVLIGYTKGDPFYVGRWLQILINNGDGTFSDQTSFYLPQSDNTATWPMFIRPANLEGGRQLDFGLVTNGAGDNAPHLYLRDGNGAFVPGPSVARDFQAWTFVDLRGDGSHDIAGVTNDGAVWIASEIRTPVRPQSCGLCRRQPR